MNSDVNYIQALVDHWSSESQKARSDSQMTLGGLITALEALPPERMVVGFGSLRSYRGYYSDLAFSPVESTQRADALLKTCRGAMGQVYEGYKGGEYQMGARTPLWFSNWGEASQLRLMDLNTDGDPIAPILEAEEW